MYLNMVILFILGLILGSLFVKVGLRLGLKLPILGKSRCLSCEHELKLYEQIPIISYLIQKKKCNYCNEKISSMYFYFEIITAILFVLTYLVYIDSIDPVIYIIYGLLIISSLVIVVVSDINYYIIPNEVLIFFLVIIVLFKIYIGIINDEVLGIMDAGYEIIFMLFDAFIMFIIMYIIKKIGDLFFNKMSIGGGDIKLMSFIAVFMGYRLGIVILFIASFLALPISIINIHKNDKQVLPFGPYLAIATIILLLLNINFDQIIDFIH